MTTSSLLIAKGINCNSEKKAFLRTFPSGFVDLTMGEKCCKDAQGIDLEFEELRFGQDKKI